jgi:hypothetical protein
VHHDIKQLQQVIYNRVHKLNSDYIAVVFMNML